MPKAKPKVPKTEKMWMAFDPVNRTKGGVGLVPAYFGQTRQECMVEVDPLIWGSDLIPVRVRIMPEAEYQRLIAEKLRK